MQEKSTFNRTKDPKRAYFSQTKVIRLELFLQYCYLDSSAKKEKVTHAKPLELPQNGNYHLKMIALARHCHFPLQSERHTCISNSDYSDSTDRCDVELKLYKTNTNIKHEYINSKTVNCIFEK